MRYALISDIHANLPALRSVLERVEAEEDLVATHHLGDLVGYAPWPDETVDLLARSGITGIAGNYDTTVATDYRHCGCRYEDPEQERLSHLSYAWTRKHVSAETKRRLAALPFRMDLRPLGGHAGGPRVILVHGNPVLNTFYWTEDRSDGFARKMIQAAGASPGDVLCFGHTHKPWQRTVDAVHLVNTGSVGRPKDGDWRAGFVLLEVNGDGAEADFLRVEYPVEEAARAIVASELPDAFAEHLRTGGAPG